MKSETWKRAVEAATVRIDGVGGQGVLVSGGFILTSAHCINWDSAAFIETITTRDERCLRVTLGFADPVTDIAILRPLEGREYRGDVDRFEAWCKETPAVQVADLTLPLGDSLPVEILSHDRRWIPASITRYGNHEPSRSGSFALIADQTIQARTSGGPIVDSDGWLVGVVSNGPANDSPLGFFGNVPIASLALPRWFWGLIDHSRAAMLRP